MSESQYADARRLMIERQLKPRDIHDPAVLRAMSLVPREEFVLGDRRDEAYDDCALPIDSNQTISQPFTVAFMCQSLQLTGEERVLEIGTGSGYGAAVLSHLAREVYSIERIPALARNAAQTLSRLGYGNVHCGEGDGTWGWPEHAPYDAIVTTAAAPALPEPFKQQLADGGRIVIPIGTSRAHQTMMRFTLKQGLWNIEDLGAFAFVPLLGDYGWQDR